MTAELSRVVEREPAQVHQLAIRAKIQPAGVGPQLEALECEHRRLASEVEALRRGEWKSGVVQPQSFAPIASERLNRSLAGSTRALVAFKPADITEAVRILGPLGVAAVGTAASNVLSSTLADGDIATRLDSLNLLALVNRDDEHAVRSWIESALHALGSHIFETGSRSTRLGFAAGYVTSDRVRQLEPLVRQALQAAEGAPGAVNRGDLRTDDPATEMAGVSWEIFIPQALQERRFAIALRPIEDLAKGSRLYEAIPRLLDSAGGAIDVESFYGPAQRLGLLNSIERRLVGYAFVAQLLLGRKRESTRMLVPLGSAALDDRGLPALLRSLASHPGARPVMETLVIELDQADVAGRIRDVESLSSEIGRFGCGLGIRGFTPVRSSEQLLDDLHFATVRFAPDMIERLKVEEALRSALRAAAGHCATTGAIAIASDVPDTNAIAMLYNLGIGTVEGPVIGEATLFSPPAAEEEPLLRELGST